MRLKKGDSAKNFTLKDIHGKEVSLEDLKDKKVLLSFYRYASCPLCNLRVAEVINQYEKLQSEGLVILSFFQSPKKHIMKYVGKQDVPFSIIADPKRKIYKLYGVENSWLGYILGGISLKMIKALFSGFWFGKADGARHLLPADFLIEDMKIVEAFYGKTIAEHIPFEQIYTFLKTKI